MSFFNKLGNIKVTYIAMIAVIAFGIILLSLYQANSEQKTISKIPQQEYMKNLTVTHFTESGAIKDQIQAKYWAYIPAKQHSTLEQPNLHVHKPNGAEWIITSNHGVAHHETLNSEISIIELQDNVYIERLASNNFTPVKMKTSHLTYFPKEELVETDKFVEMEKPGLLITGFGLKSKLQDSLVTLFDKVHTQYVRES